MSLTFWIIISVVTYNLYFDGEIYIKRFHLYFLCMENAIQLWICRMKWKIGIYSISFSMVLQFRIHFWFSEERNLIDNQFNLFLDNKRIVQYFERHSEFKLPTYLREKDIIEKYFDIWNISMFLNIQIYLNK